MAITTTTALGVTLFEDADAVDLVTHVSTGHAQRMENVFTAAAALGAQLALTRAGVPFGLKTTSDGASVQVLILEGDRATMADEDEAYVTMRLSDSAGTQTEVARFTWAAPDVTVGTNVDGRIDLGVMTAGTLADELSLTGAALYPASNGGLALGIAATNEFAHLFLAEGAVINWDNGDVTLTQTGNLLAVAGGTFEVLTATANQMAIRYDASNHLVIDVSSAGAVTYNATGASAGHTFSDNVFTANGTGIVVGHTAKLAIGGVTPEFQVLGTGTGTDTAITAQAFSADANGAYIFLGKSRGATVASYTIVQADDVLGNIYFSAANGTDMGTAAALIQGVVDGTPGASNDMPGRLVFYTTADGAGTVTERMRINSAGAVYVGDTANASMTQGLTLNQGAADNQILACKSSDTAHALLTGGETTMETDDYLTFQKTSVSGGARIAVVDADGTNPVVAYLTAFGGLADTTDTTASTATITVQTGEHNGANALIATPANANALVIRCATGAGTFATRLLLKGDDGELHLGNTTLVALDAEDDVMAVRGLQLVRTGGRGIVPTAHDAPAYSYDRLRAMGVVGEKDARGEFLIRVQPYLNLHDGAIWQLWTRLQVALTEIAALKQHVGLLPA